MRRILVVVALALNLGGCANVQKAFDVFSAVTVGVANPLTPERLHVFEASAELMFIGLNTYKRNCDRGSIPQSCKDVIARMRVYTRRIPSYLDRLRAFVRNNDQVNAISIYNEISGLISQVKQEAYINNVRLDGV